MNTKRLLIPLLTASVMTFSASGALADAVGTAYLNIFGLKFVNDDAAAAKLTVGTDIVLTNFTNNGDTNAELNGTPDHHDASAPAGPLGLDVLHSCVGACGYVENSFSYITKPTGASADYALGDVNLLGASVNFPGVTTADVVARTLAEVSLTGPTNIGSASGNNLGANGQVTMLLTAGFTGDFRVDFSADLYLRALLSADEMAVEADASVGFSISIIDTTTGLDVFGAGGFSPNVLNDGRSATVPGQDFEHTLAYVCGAGCGAFSMIAGRDYQVTIDQHSDANATLIPEPDSIVLLGLGLLIFSAFRQRQAA